MMKSRPHSESSFDNEDIKQIFNRYYTVLCAFARKYLRDAHEAEDVVCGLFVHLWEQRHTLRIWGEVEPYLISAVHNRCLNVLRASANQKANNKHYAALHTPDPDNETQADRRIDDQIFHNFLVSIMCSLPPRCAKILFLSREHNLSYQEIATRLHISVGTVKTQMFRAHKKLREAFRNYTFNFFL